jgi:hypothetical protein
MQPITCPTCEHYDPSPQFRLMRMAFEVRSHRAGGKGGFKQMLIPMLHWTCAGCQKSFLVACCASCGHDMLMSVKEGETTTFGFSCFDCRRRLGTN